MINTQRPERYVLQHFFAVRRREDVRLEQTEAAEAAGGCIFPGLTLNAIGVNFPTVDFRERWCVFSWVEVAPSSLVAMVS